MPGLAQLRHDAIAIYDAAIQGVQPRAALTEALATCPRGERVRLIGLGKAARAMAGAAVEYLDSLGIPLAGGLLVMPDEGPPSERRLIRLVGDHPLPGTRSAAAASALAIEAAQAVAGDEVWVLLSGGTSSLIGAPIAGISANEYLALLRVLGQAGLPIGDLNRVRKRFSQWGAGRLAYALRRAERVRLFVLSDVPGDDLGDIGSGPTMPDPSTATAIRQYLATLPAALLVPEFADRLLEQVERGALPETPKPGDGFFDRVTTHLIGSNATARHHAARRARDLGYAVVESGSLLTDGAAEAGRWIGRQIATAPPTAQAWIWGGETTVSLGADHGLGGRCQELALAAAQGLAAVTDPVVLLAGGTDGRDGPTDAAGALVDPQSWGAIIEAGIDPEEALVRHNAYPAFAAIGGLLRRGLTGTNVMDVVIALSAGRDG